MASWYSLDLTKSERTILEAIWAAPSKTVKPHVVRAAVRLTPRGLQAVLSRMADRSLVATVLNHSGLTITFKGMQALGVTSKAAA